MYFIINKTQGLTFTHHGNYPGNMIDKMLEKGEDLIVVSTYSNTIKVPIDSDTIDGVTEWRWKEYPLPDNL
jgi:hypothetical protein